MQRVFSALTRPPVPLVVGTFLSVLVVYYGSELLRRYVRGWFGWLTPTVATVLCVLIVLGVVAYAVVRSIKARAKARSIEQEIRAQGRVQMDALPPSSRSELEELQERFDEALESLRSSKLGRGALYAFPWYVIIGPPGSGKTTAITESGLNFPFLKGQSQGRGIRGLGGTRNCDWWFTDQSILLDTAGRYTTQAEDRDEWISFLGMIKRSRKWKPINGVVVAISIADVVGATPEGIEKHAVTIRERIDELVRELNVVFPVYLVFTKCDLFDGFVESFGALSKEERAQVWGMTFTKEEGDERTTVSRFSEEMGLLCRRLEEERLRMLVPDQPAEKRRKLLSLTLQMRSAMQPLREFVAKLTEPNPFSEASELRGVYLTSGTQEGAPIDFVMEKMSSALGLPQGAQASPLISTDAKSYFLRDMFSKVLYADKDLAHSSAETQKRRALARAATIYGAAAVAVFGLVMFFLGWSETRGLLSGFEAAARERLDIAPERPGAPSPQALRVLNLRRDKYKELQDAYVFAPFAPSREAVVGAMVDYSRGVRKAFLEPIRDYVRERLRSYVDAGQPTKDGDEYRGYSHLITVYRALGGGFGEADADAEGFEPILPGELRGALTELSLWTWDRSLVGKSRETASDSQEVRHLEVYLSARQFDDNTRWRVKTDKGLLGKAVALHRRSDAPARIVERTIEEQRLLEIDPEEAAEKVREELEKQGASAAEVDVEEVRRMQTTMNLKKLASLSLSDSSSLDALARSLNELTDLSDGAGLESLDKALGALQSTGALSKNALTADPIRNAYIEALKVIGNFSQPIEKLRLGVSAAGGAAGGGYLLNEVATGESDWLKAFGLQWEDAHGEILRQLDVMRGQLGGVTELSEDQVVTPVRTSLMSMLDEVVGAVARELRGEVKRRWDSAAGSRLRLALDKFPFRDDVEVDVSRPEFEELFAPSGVLAAEEAVVRKVQRAWKARGGLQLSAEFEMFLARVAAIRKGCFSEEEGAVLRFKVNDLRWKSPLVRDVTLRIQDSEQGPKQVSASEGTAEMISGPERAWPVGGKGSRLIVQTADGPFMVPPAEDAASSPWSLLRLLRSGRPQPASETVLVTWEVSYVDDDGTKKALEPSVEFSVVGSEFSLNPAFFELASPAYIFAADRK